MYILQFKIIGLMVWEQNILNLGFYFFLYILVKYVQVNFYLINKNLVERLSDQKNNLINLYLCLINYSLFI